MKVLYVCITNAAFCFDLMTHIVTRCSNTLSISVFVIFSCFLCSVW